jgi:hypothetical protein
MNFIVLLPFKTGNAIADAVIGGWQFNGLGIMQSGLPFSVT